MEPSYLVTFTYCFSYFFICGSVVTSTFIYKKTQDFFLLQKGVGMYRNIQMYLAKSKEVNIVSHQYSQPDLFKMQSATHRSWSLTIQFGKVCRVKKVISGRSMERGCIKRRNQRI